MTATTTNIPASVAPAAKPRSKRRGLMVALPVVLLLAGGGYWLMSGRYETTDNAYLHQARIAVAASVGGRVESVSISDSETVKAGDVLFQVDPVPYRLALAQTEAAVAAARLGAEQQKVAYKTATTQLKMAEDNAAYQTSERLRQEGLSAKGVASTTALDDAIHTERVAMDQRDLAKSAVAMALAALGGNPEAATDSLPGVQAALVARDQAAYNLEKSVVTAPADGVVYQASSFKAGQMVAPGVSLFTLVQTGDVWVEANFKETQLDGLQVGQTAEVAFDVNRTRKFKAVVDSIGAGTGSEFSLLPAQNATGNWVKVTQRVPVKLRLVDAADVAGLASGLSAEVSVDTGRTRSLSDLNPFTTVAEK